MGGRVRSACAWALVLVSCAVSCGRETDARAPAAESAPPQTAPRSVVLVTIDTLRADALGAYGGAEVSTPHLDRLASQGVLFEQAHATSPNTLPSHASILTGQYPFEHGVRSNIGYGLPDEAVSLAERVAEAGYATGAEVAAPVLRRETGISQGFAHFRDTDSPGVRLQTVAADLPEGSGPIPLETRDARDITDAGIDFLERRAGRPFLLWLHYFDPHFPYVPPDRFLVGSSVPRWPREAEGPELWETRRRLYAAEVSYVDEQLGRLVGAIGELGLAESSLLVVTSDHGEGLGEHGEGSHSFYVHQSTMRVPLLVRGPEVPAGRRVARPVSVVQVMPTVLDWLGLDARAEPAPPSLPLHGSGFDFPIYGESIELSRVFGAPVLRFLRWGQWKYVHKPRPALFDLAADPGERRDAAAAQGEQLERLQGRLADLLGAAEPARDARISLSPETRAQLEALGYVAGSEPEPTELELAPFAADAPDPADLLEDVGRLTRVGAGGPTRGEEEDIAALRELARRYPGSGFILEKLFATEYELGRLDAAVNTLRKLRDLRPEDSETSFSLGGLLLELGRQDAARAAFAETLERFPCHQASRLQLANLYAGGSDHAERVALLEAGLERCDPTPQLLNDLGYALATAPDPSVRDGERAVALTTRAVEALPGDPLLLDSLAAALAETGRFEQARVTARRALQGAREGGLPPPVVQLLATHLELVEAGQPIRE